MAMIITNELLRNACTAQAASKLAGPILHLATFVLEATGQSALCLQTSSGLADASEPSQGAQTGAGGPLAEASGQTGGTGQTGPGCSGAISRQLEPGQQQSADSRPGFFLVVSEKQAKVFQLPSLVGSPSSLDQQHQPAKPSQDHQHQLQQQHQLAKMLLEKRNCVAKIDISESSLAKSSSLVWMRQPDECCLISYLANGNLLVHSLPQLKLLLEVDFVPMTSSRLASSMLLKRNGHCLYQPSPSEICKFTLSSQYAGLLNDMLGHLYVAREMPEMPRANFFKSLFSAATASSAAQRQSERDELFGECAAGKPSRGVAKHISGLDKLKGAQGGLGQELRMAREGLDERQEKLSEIEDKTLQMLNQSETYAQTAHNLAQKFKEKKWYHFN